MREKGGRDQMDLDPDAMKRRMVDLLNDPRAEEIVIRENYGRDGAGEIGAIARNLRLHFKQYGKGTNTTLVASKVPLPDYRADLDGRRRAEHEVDMSASTMDIVTKALRNTPSVEDLNTNLHGLTHSPTKRQRGDAANDKGKGAAATHAPLARDAAVDAAVAEAEAKRRASPRVIAAEATRARLPAFNKRDELLAAVDGAQVLVVSGETGCGKTTQLPQFVLERALAGGDASVTGILCTQPRRISAISVAARVAQERGEDLGESVGYQIRLEAKRSKRTRLLFCTTGVLLRRLATEPTLASVSHVFVDEIHERGMNEDFLLVVLRDLLPKRPDLKVVLMSATLDAESFAKYFDGAPLCHIPGFTYPVEELFLEDALEAFRGNLAVPPPDNGHGGGGTWGGRRKRFGRQNNAPALGYNPDEDDGDEGAEGAEGADEDDPSWACLSRGTQESLRHWRRRCALDDKVDVDLVKNLVAEIVADRGARRRGFRRRDPRLSHRLGRDHQAQRPDASGSNPRGSTPVRGFAPARRDAHGEPTRDFRQTATRRSQDHPLHQHRRDVHHDRRHHARRRLRQGEGEDLRRAQQPRVFEAGVDQQGVGAPAAVRLFLFPYGRLV